MFIKDLAHNLKVSAAYAGGTISTNTDTDGALVIDNQGFGGILFVVYTGTVTDGTYTLKIMESDNSNGSSPSEVGAYQVQEGITGADDSVAKKVGAMLTKRYAFLRITSGATSSGGVFKGAIAIQGGAADLPVGLSKL